MHPENEWPVKFNKWPTAAKKSDLGVWFFFLACHRPTSASGKLDRPLIKLDRPLIFQGASGHFDENRAILTKVRPFLIKSLQNVTKMYQNGNFPKK